ncbi:hypothetical protein CGMCC3_g4107 [Colletotrichum fructicola]|uniref:Succinate--CoA ligase [ADP-forming] subunit beta n=2 Tax=Colletotrichum fructicola (strain Nara gc5) TaxID=1213859 RepID=A0A7J6J7D5_COLFN|nr:uncharacterized protein CGMCC3_g4107 [Colletotrichum fructicola]KAE9579732.1 hypothetical protein CGMCC3_g4107 [Colletotrichum fructicola]KAF4429235.1 Succinate-CoA ligase [ADP-forming] subunit beta [Colletotrichum fructicola]KAF4485938.1 Succinate--CoA ligase [ADP-forming] subunit beta [Colletotrichum fructicola Nara gc5]KAF5486512.1 Succinate--CoA ligase [ADP-forming] subunit beta [Colletotrichum fructicola]
MFSRSLTSKLRRSQVQVLSRQQLRCLTLHEPQARSILAEFNVPVPRGRLAKTPAEVESIYSELGVPCIIKAQLPQSYQAQGVFEDGLTGRFKRARSSEEAVDMSKSMLGRRFRTTETGDGVLVEKVYVTEMIKSRCKWHLTITFDRERYCPVIIASRTGGEALDQEQPERLRTTKFGLTEGITSEVVDKVSKVLHASPAERENLRSVLRGLCQVFKSKDVTSLEVYPIINAIDETITCVDTKITIDDAASKRQEDIFALRDRAHDIAEEAEAEKYGLVYVKMDGNIGNVVNGAGLAMATNDAIALHGGASANFLDAGGQATKETMVKAFEIILRDTRVKTILVNIYGGITRGDMIAESIIGAATELGPLKVPMVVRLQGTNSELGLKMLEEAKLGLHTEADFGKAAQKAVELVRSAT